MMNRIVLIAILLLCATTAWSAPAVKVVEAVYTFYGNDTQSRKECERLALENARIKALAQAFGTVLSQTSRSDLRSDNRGEQTDFMQISETDVKGEWIEDIGQPQYSYSMDEDGNPIVTCRIKGRAREISNEAPDFVAEVLQNGNTLGQSGTTFRSGDEMKLFIKTPVDGYLVVYLVGPDRRAYSLLPYLHSEGGCATVRHGREYVFFDEDKALQEFGEVDPLILSTDDNVEYNQLYVIFSPKKFVKAPDEYMGDGVPRSLPFNDFYSWLGKARRNDASMAVKVIQLTINN